MKRILYTLAAVATFASCSNDELVEVTPKQAINFGNAFVENATRAIDNTYSNNNKPLTFKVYGTVKSNNISIQDAETVNIFSGVDVTKAENANSWEYNVAYTQYWVANCDYNFAAIVGGTESKTIGSSAYKNSIATDNTTKMPTFITYNVNTQADLLYATQYATTNDNAEPTSGVDTDNENRVNFTFDHLLSKVHFTFKNTITTNTNDIKYSYKISDIKITNAVTSNTYTLGTNAAWNKTDWTNNTSQLAFGNASDATSGTDNTAKDICSNGSTLQSATSHNTMLMIPTTYDGSTNKLTITFTKDLFLNETQIQTTNVRMEVEKAITFTKGHAYNLIVELPAPGNQIKFKVEAVNEWGPTGDDKTSPQDIETTVVESTNS